jgi:hypothetical protein
LQTWPKLSRLPSWEASGKSESNQYATSSITQMIADYG